MKRRLFNIAALVSLLLCLGSGPLWIWSHWHGAAIGGPNSRKTSAYYALIDTGKIQFVSFRDPAGGLFVPKVMETGNAHKYDIDPGVSPLGISRSFHKFGFSYYSGSVFGFQIRAAGFPVWLVLIVTSLLPILWFRSHRKRNRHRPGFCKSCGYDLRATPGRCPECGREAGVVTSANLERRKA